MPEEITQSLIQRIEKLEQDFKDHQHLGNDGSHIFEGLTAFSGKSLLINPNIAYGSQFVAAPFVITDGKADNLVARVGGITEFTVGTRDSTGEQNNFIMQTGKALPPNYLAKPANQTNWDEVNYAQTRLITVPSFPASISGPSYIPTRSFFLGSRTPQVRGIGTIASGGSVLVDSNANFATNVLQFALLTVNNAETYRIISNTTNTITIGTANPNGATTLSTFNVSGTFSYYVETPMLLGSSDIPWTRLYVGEDIRLGYGSSAGTAVRYIKWGFGSPEGVITANTGSLYLRFDGGTTTSLYVKTSGTGNTGWTAK